MKKKIPEEDLKKLEQNLFTMLKDKVGMEDRLRKFDIDYLEWVRHVYYEAGRINPAVIKRVFKLWDIYHVYTFK